MEAIVGIEICFRACRSIRGMNSNKREKRKEITKTKQKKWYAERIGKSLCMRFYFFNLLSGGGSSYSHRLLTLRAGSIQIFFLSFYQTERLAALSCIRQKSYLTMPMGILVYVVFARNKSQKVSTSFILLVPKSNIQHIQQLCKLSAMRESEKG